MKHSQKRIFMDIEKMTSDEFKAFCRSGNKNYLGVSNCSNNINISCFIINQYYISLGTVLYQLIKI